MSFLLRSDNYFRRTGGGGRGIGFVPPDRVLQARDGVARKSRFKNQINRNANNK